MYEKSAFMKAQIGKRRIGARCTVRLTIAAVGDAGNTILRAKLGRLSELAFSVKAQHSTARHGSAQSSPTRTSSPLLLPTTVDLPPGNFTRSLPSTPACHLRIDKLDRDLQPLLHGIAAFIQQTWPTRLLRLTTTSISSRPAFRIVYISSTRSPANNNRTGGLRS